MGLFASLDLKAPTAAPASPSLTVTVASDLGLTHVVGELDALDFPKGYRGSPVKPSADLDRIAALPRRAIDVTDHAAAEAWTAHLRRENLSCDCVARWGFCITDLKPIQGWGLEEASNALGFLGPIGVGHGKEGLCILAPWAFESKRALYLVPANLKPQLLLRDLPQWSAHFHVPSLAGGPFAPGKPVLQVMSYNDLSSPKSSDALRRLNPDLIILNEAHNLGNRKATRTKRFLRYMSETFVEVKGQKVKPRLFAVSGTLTKKSIKEYAHLAEHALGQRSPLPLFWPTVEEWAGAIDASDAPAPMGQLRRLCTDGETARGGFRRRLVETEGVVATEEGALDTLLTISERKLNQTPEEVALLISNVREMWQRPDGEELVDVLSKSSVCRQLAAGFFYRWRWPRKETPEVILAWLDARKAWHKEVREKLKRSTEHMDSPLLVTKAAIRWHDGYVWINPNGGHKHGDSCFGPYETLPGYRLEDGRYVDEEARRPLLCKLPEGSRQQIPPHTRHGPLPTWESEFWPEWKRLRATAEPATEAVWINDFLAQDAAEWARTHRGIVWYEHDCFGRRVAELAGVPFYGGGPDASARIIEEKGKRSIVASIRAHGTGKNLQMFARNLMGNPPADAAVWEQTLARTHRPGQKAEEVVCEVYRHTSEMRDAIDTAVGRARYISETLGGAQKLLYAVVEFQPDPTIETVSK